LQTNRNSQESLSGYLQQVSLFMVFAAQEHPFGVLIYITNIMRQSGNKAGLFRQRAILVIGALACLCVSDSAGPRLLPLPATTLIIADNSNSLISSPCASRIPGSSREPSPHFEMVTGSQYRARDRHHHVPIATHVRQASLQLRPINLAGIPVTYCPLNHNTVSLSIPKGRAPPRSS